MASGFGAKGGREVNPVDIEIEEGSEPVVEAASEMAVGEMGDGQWHEEEEEAATCEDDHPVRGTARQLQGHGHEEMGRQPHFAPAAGAKMAGLEATVGSDDDKPSS